MTEIPWVRIPNLASHVMALNIARLDTDRKHHFSHRFLLLETFVDSRYFNGACYKASNWQHIGHAYGSTKQGKGYRYHGLPKEIYLYVIDRDFRRIIDCRQQPAPVYNRPPHPQTQTKVEELSMLLEHCKWHPDLTADLNLDEDEVKKMGEELVCFHQHFHDCFGRIGHKRLGLAYMSGLKISLSELIKASIIRWPIEQCFEEGKEQLDMDSYEHRSWPAWHRHMAYVFLSLHFMIWYSNPQKGPALHRAHSSWHVTVLRDKR
jgi:hypothetical protein